MSLETKAALLILGFVAIGLTLFLIRRKQIAQAKEGNSYRWKPAQDYDVIQEGETSMTPAFPKLVKREKDKAQPNDSGDK